MRLIDADALFKALGFAEPCSECDHLDPIRHWRCEDAIWNDVCGAIFDAPTIDAVPVVRCKDCEYWKVETEQCDLFDADDYCSMAKRKAEP